MAALQSRGASGLKQTLNAGLLRLKRRPEPSTASIGDIREGDEYCGGRRKKARPVLGGKYRAFPE